MNTEQQAKEDRLAELEVMHDRLRKYLDETGGQIRPCVYWKSFDNILRGLPPIK